MSVPKTITVKWKGMTYPKHIIFTLSPPSDNTLSSGFKALAWKIIVARGNGSEVVQFEERYGFGQKEPSRGDILHGTVFTDKGHEVQLELTDNGTTVWSSPKDVPGESMSAMNSTKAKRNISFGTLEDDDSSYFPLFIWPDVPPTQRIQVDIDPVLQVFIAPPGVLKHGDIIPDDMAHRIPVWKEKVRGLRALTQLELTVDAQDAVGIKPVDPSVMTHMAFHLVNRGLPEEANPDLGL